MLSLVRMCPLGCNRFIDRLIAGSGKGGRKDDEREELDFQFDEEVVTPKHNRLGGQPDLQKRN